MNRRLIIEIVLPQSGEPKSVIASAIQMGVARATSWKPEAVTVTMLSDSSAANPIEASECLGRLLDLIGHYVQNDATLFEVCSAMAEAERLLGRRK